jgi:hypothetical protein
MVVARGVRACRTRPRYGTRHTGHSRAHWGDADAGRPGLPSHAPWAGRQQAEQETAAWSLPMAVVGGGSVTHEARSGGGPGAGFLADMRRSNQGRVDGALQMLEDLPEHLALRDGGAEPQRPTLTPRAVGHSQCQDALQQPCPAPARRPGVRRLLVHPLLARRGDDGPAQVAVRCQTPSGPAMGQPARDHPERRTSAGGEPARERRGGDHL